jgi:catechol 2,3-dioxygenase-like lactoylglutathione lyase family enzyme
VTTTKIPYVAAIGIDHVAVQTDDLASSIRWYQDFFGCTTTWQMDGRFSELSHQRLPGISRLAEVAVGDLRFHLFTRSNGRGEQPSPDANQFQHVCLGVASVGELNRWRDHWFRLFASGRYTFARQEPATPIDVDDEGTHTFYARDVNGLEFEFTCHDGTR